ncbi:MAG: hypothetical protein U0638_08265 [Phycisphaerales bacterium]
MNADEHNPPGQSAWPQEREPSHRWRRLSIVLLCAAVIDLALVVLFSTSGIVPFMFRGELFRHLRGAIRPQSTLIFLYRDQDDTLSAHDLGSNRWRQLSRSLNGDPPPNLRRVGLLGIMSRSTSLGVFTECAFVTNWVDPAADLLGNIPRDELDRALSDFIDEFEDSNGGPSRITKGWCLALKAGQTHWTYVNWWCVIHDVLASAAWIGVLVLLPRAKRERAYERAFHDYFGPKCPACGYPREGLATGTCPECGRVNSMPAVLRSGIVPAGEATKR